MIKEIIEFENERIVQLPFFSSVNGLAELRNVSDGKVAPAIYKDKKWQSIQFTGLGTTYWRKNSDVNYSQVDSFTSGRAAYESIFDLVFIALTTRSEFPEDDNYSADRLAQSLIKAITLTGGDLKRSLKAQQLTVRPLSYSTNSAAIKEQEFTGITQRDFMQKDIAISIEFEVTVVAKNYCVDEVCTFDFPETV
jgi:hypothetical protein